MTYAGDTIYNVQNNQQSELHHDKKTVNIYDTKRKQIDTQRHMTNKIII